MQFWCKIYSFHREMLHSGYLNRGRRMLWREDKEEKSGGKALVDLGSHMIDLVRFVLGDIEEINASSETVVRKGRSFEGRMVEVQVDDWALPSSKISSDIKGSIEASRVVVGNEGARLSIYGDKGSLHLDLGNLLNALSDFSL